jgi:hypothetical protein
MGSFNFISKKMTFVEFVFVSKVLSEFFLFSTLREPCLFYYVYNMLELGYSVDC